MNSRVLYVDDDIFGRQAGLEMLTDLGLSVVPTDSVDEALDLLDEEEFHAVVLDIMMAPGQFNALDTAGGYKTGLALAREIRSRRPELPILAVTLSRDPEIEAWFTRDRSVGYVQKPVVPSEVAWEIRRLILRSLERPRAFIVHGRDDTTRTELADVLRTTFDFSHVVVLSEEPSRGRTILEKFEQQAAETDLVFVLATGDDVGRLATGSKRSRRRPRMNVLFELGYFLGALRRKTGRVFLLQDGAIEMPSDLAGVVYVDISQGVAAATDALRRELRDWLD